MLLEPSHQYCRLQYDINAPEREKLPDVSAACSALPLMAISQRNTSTRHMAVDRRFTAGRFIALARASVQRELVI